MGREEMVWQGMAWYSMIEQGMIEDDKAWGSMV
jgi:hypothetical protein